MIGLCSFDSYSISAAVCVAMPGATGVADSRCGADVSRHRPTSLSKLNRGSCMYAILKVLLIYTVV